MTRFQKLIKPGRLLPLMLVMVACSGQYRSQCQLLTDTTLTTMDRIIAINANSAQASADAAAQERQIGQLYFDASQTVEILPITQRQLKTIQTQLVAAYQKASDYRYQASNLMPVNDDPIPPEQLQAIQTVQQQSEADIPAIVQELVRICPKD